LVTPILSKLEAAFTVETIMTPRSDFLIWTNATPVEQWQKARELQIDTIPIAKNGDIKEFFYRDFQEPILIYPDYSIPHGTLITEVVKKFGVFNNQPKHSVLFVTYENVIVGLVTPADLNKMSARTYYYTLIAELEMTLAGAIRHYFKDSQESIKNRLNSKDVQDIEVQMKENDQKIDIVHFLQLSQLLKIIQKEPELYKQIGFKSGKEVKTDLGGLVDFRHNVAHPVRMILDDKQGILGLNKYLTRLRDVIGKINKSK
jgi:hypothetical protein